MTPRPLDSQVVLARLVAMEEMLDDLAALGEVTAERLATDRTVRYVVERILTQLVGLAAAANAHIAAGIVGRIPKDYRDSFSVAAQAGALNEELANRLRPSAGTRNALIHDYLTINLELVAEAARRAGEDYRDYLTSVARFLAALDDNQPHGRS